MAGDIEGSTAVITDGGNARAPAEEQLRHLRIAAMVPDNGTMQRRIRARRKPVDVGTSCYRYLVEAGTDV